MLCSSHHSWRLLQYGMKTHDTHRLEDKALLFESVIIKYRTAISSQHLYTVSWYNITNHTCTIRYVRFDCSINVKGGGTIIGISCKNAAGVTMGMGVGAR